MEIKIKDLLVSIDESKQKIAVKKALVGFLKARYLSRDGLPAQSHIAYERSTVTEDVIHEVIVNLEKEVKQEENRLTASLQETING